jgi:hypothetical protein
VRVNQTCTGRRDSNGRSQARPLQGWPGRHRGNAHQSRRPGPAVEDAFPGLTGMQPAKAGDRSRTGVALGLTRRRAGGVAGAPGIPQARAAFSPAKGIATRYAEVVDA